jgi:glycosyltransferase involved in cell wall biosynthesis
MRDLICDGKNGFLIPTGDWKEMADLAVHAVENFEISIRISKEARISALNYSWKRVATETADFYISLRHQLVAARK